MEIITDFPERIQKGTRVYVGDGYLPLEIQSSCKVNQGLKIRFTGYDNPESVRGFHNSWVYVRADDRPPLSEGEYYHHQIIGMSVVTLENEVLGKVVEILVTGANDVYVVETELGKEVLIPAIESIVREISLERGEIRVALIPGILPE